MFCFSNRLVYVKFRCNLGTKKKQKHIKILDEGKFCLYNYLGNPVIKDRFKKQCFYVNLSYVDYTKRLPIQ